MENELSEAEKKLLLQIARQAIVEAVHGETMLPLSERDLPLRLREKGATFVTLTKHGNLRGCIGTIEPYQSLVEDVREHAIAAALADYRFPPVIREEIDSIKIEISRLSQPILLEFSNPEELLSQLHPGIDGVIIRDDIRRATFLPQVWDKLPEKEEFLDHLCMKMGASPGFWKTNKAQIFIYQVEEFHE